MKAWRNEVLTSSSRFLISLRLLSVIAGMVVSLVLLEGVIRYWHLANEIVYRPNPFFGWSHTPGDSYRLKSDDSEVDISINSLGLRDYEYPHKKPKNVFRVLVLGDSFSEAFQVPLEKSFTKQMELFLNSGQSNQYAKIEVINTGVSGYGTDNEFLFFQSEGYKYQPDVVLLAFCICNDVRNNGHELEKLSAGGDRKPYFIFEENGMVLKNYPFERDGNILTKFKLFLNRNVRSYAFLRETWDRMKYQKRVGRIGMPLDLHLYGEQYSQDWENAWLVTKGLIQRLEIEAKKSGAELLVALIPTGFQVHSQFWDKALEIFPEMRNKTWNLDKPNRILRAFLDEENIQYIDLLPEFREQAEDGQEEFYLLSDGHWNERGHQLAGRLITENLLASGLIENSQKTEILE